MSRIVSVACVVLSLFAAPAFANPTTCADGIGTIPGDLAWQGTDSPARLGMRVAKAGDLTGDGTTELLVGAPYALETGLECGKAYILSAPAGALGTIQVTSATVLATIFTTQRNALLGMSVAGIGDFDGDGFGDLAIGLPGAPGYANGDADDTIAYTGAVQIVYGAASIPPIINIDTLAATRIVGATSGEKAGFTVAAAGDVNGDGAPDLLIGAPNASDTITGLLPKKGRAYIIFGGRARRAIIDLEKEADVTIEGSQSYAQLGYVVAGIGDMNADGIDDVAVGSPYFDRLGYVDAGETLVIFGAHALPAVIDQAALPAGSGLRVSGYGTCVKLGWEAAGTDVNGDGVADLITAAPYANTNQTGSAYIVFGGTALPAELDVRALAGQGVVITGASSYGYLGMAGAAIGDVNSDGLNDIAIAAPNASNGGYAGAGAVYVLNGRTTWPGSAAIGEIASRTILGERMHAAFGEALVAAGDHNGDGGLDFAVGVPRQSPNDLACAGQVSVFFGEVIPGPSALTCSTTLIDVALTWTNNYAYGEVLIARDGQPLVTLPGDATAYTDHAVPTGSHAYSVRARAEGVTTNAVECTTQVQVLPVRDVTCVANARNISLTWSLGMPYDSIRVLRGGIVAVELPGNATAWTDTEVPYGALSYAIIGVIGPYESVPAACEVYVPRPPAELVCKADGRTVALAWMEPDPFDHVEILRDGTLLTALPGGIARFVDANVVPGLHTYALRSFMGANTSEFVSCEVTVVPPPSAVSCSATASSAAIVWEAGAAYEAVAVFLDGERVATLPGDMRTYTFENLAPGTHVIEVAGVLAGALSVRAPCTIEILAPPRDFACTADGARVNLVWQNAGTYVEIVVIRDGVEVARISGGASTFVDETAAAGAHTYEIYGTAERTLGIRATCQVVRLNPPANFTCAALGNDVTLRWTNGSTYAEVVVARDGTVIATLAGAATEYVDAGVAQGTHVYTLRGRAPSSQSAPATCEVVSPGAPSAFTCAALGASVTLKWTNGDVYGEIHILRDGARIATLPGDAREYIDNTAIAGQAYEYQIMGVIGASLSDPASCRIALPLPPASLACAAVEGRVRLTWQIQGNASAVIVTRDGTQVAELPAGTTSFEETVAAPGVYVYALRTVLGSAVSAPTACEVETIVAPTALACIATSGVVTLNWVLESGCDSLAVLKNGVEIARLAGGQAGSNGTYEETNVAPGDYVYTLVVESGASSASSRCEVHAPAPVSALNCFVAEGAITLSWENPEVYDQIVIMRNGEQLTVLGGDAATYRDVDAQPGVAYTYELFGQKGPHRTPPARCSIKIPAPVTSLACVVAGNSVTLSWTVGETYDEIRVARNGQTIASGLPGTTATYEDRDLAPGAYSYQVTGFIGGARSPATTCSVAVVPAPTALVCEVLAEAGNVRLTWANPILYEAVTIARNGQTIAQLAGTATTYVEGVPAPGSWAYTVTGRAVGAESLPASCEVDVLLPPSNIDCVADGASVTVAWTLGATYTQIRVLRDGVLVATLPGTDTAFTDRNLAPGTHVYRLIGVGTAGSSSLASAPCTTEVVAPPEQLTCVAETIGISAHVNLSWSLGGSYDSQVIERTGRDGTKLIGQVGGTETTYVDNTVVEGVYSYRVIAGIALSSAASAPCQVEIMQARFLRGDANHDRKVDIADVVFVLNAIFRGGPAFPCADAADANDDGVIDTSDAVYLITYGFNGGSPPKPPFPAIGLDPTPDPRAPDGDLGCVMPY